MTNNITIKSLSNEFQSSIDYLIKQFSSIGIQKSANDLVTLQEKKMLIEQIIRSYESSPDKLTFRRKTRSMLNIPVSGGKSKSVQVEIRKSRTFIRRKSKEYEKATLLKKENIQSTIENNKLDKTKEEKIKKEPKEKIQSKNLENKKINNQKNNNYKETNEKEKNYIKEKSTKEKNKEKNSYKKSEIKKSKRKTERNQKENEILELRNKEKKETNRYKKDQKISHIAKKENSILKRNRWMTNKSRKNITNYLFPFRYVSQIEEENDVETEIGYKLKKNQKISRLDKKNNKKYFRSEINQKGSKNPTIQNTKNRNKKKEISILENSFQKKFLPIARDIILTKEITIGELANKMAVKRSKIIEIIMEQLGTTVTVNQILDRETAQLIAEEMGHNVVVQKENELEQRMMKERKVDIETDFRIPIVTIMGHVDHGKTSLLDYIRSTKVTSDEIGGITQHISAYYVKTKDGEITFLDTPGHAVFTSMRFRGVQITDIVVLVIAADDGIMPQTIEAIQYAKSEKVPIVVAINKIDKFESNSDQIKKELATRYCIIPEEWGGDHQFVEVSAKTGKGIDELIKRIFLQAEILELKAIHKGMASGIVIESFLDRGKGPVATILVQEGTLKKGDAVLCDLEYGNVRAMHNELGHEIIEAKPSIPVEIFGLSGVPRVGSQIMVVSNEKIAREVAIHRQKKFREEKLESQKKFKLEDMFDSIKKEKVQTINIVLRADVQGSIEAISNTLLKISSEKKIQLKIVKSGVGNITETDAMLAVASNAILVVFNVNIDNSARYIIEEEGLRIHQSSIIYDLINEIEAAMDSISSSNFQKKIIGLAEVRSVFNSIKFGGSIAGCIVIKGIIKKNKPIRIIRNNIIIYEGELLSLRRFKEDINEAKNGMECGIGIKNYKNICTGDMIETFEIISNQKITDTFIQN